MAVASRPRAPPARSSGSSSPFVTQAAERLLRGEPSERVLADMRAHYGSLCSLSKHLSAVRRHVLEHARPTHLHPSLPRRLAAFANALAADGVPDESLARGSAFLRASLLQQHRALRKHAAGAFSFGVPPVDEAFRRIKLLPASTLRGFRVTKREQAQCKQLAIDSVVRKNEQLLHVPKASELLDRVAAFLRRLRDGVHAPESVSYAPLICALLLVSGRRLSEICNGRSVFAAMPERGECAALFDGQLKKHSDAAREAGDAAYVIPLLVPFRLFEAGVLALREKQRAAGRRARGRRVDELDNQQVANRYAGAVNQHVRAAFLPQLRRAHDLRALYAAMVLKAFETRGRVTFNRLAMHILGHQDLSTSLRYNQIELHDFKSHARSLGRLPVLDDA